MDRLLPVLGLVSLNKKKPAASESLSRRPYRPVFSLSDYLGQHRRVPHILVHTRKHPNPAWKVNCVSQKYYYLFIKGRNHLPVWAGERARTNGRKVQYTETVSTRSFNRVQGSQPISRMHCTVFGRLPGLFEAKISCFQRLKPISWLEMPEFQDRLSVTCRELPKRGHQFVRSSPTPPQRQITTVPRRIDTTEWPVSLASFPATVQG